MAVGGDPARSADGTTRLVATGVTDQGSIDDVIWPAFQRDVAPSAAIDYVQEVAGSTVQAHVRDLPPGRRPDVVILMSPQGFVATGLADRSEAAVRDRYPAPWMSASDGVLWPLYMEPIVAIYNTHYARPPTRWSDLEAPKWQDRMVFEEPWRMLTTGPALAELSSALDTETWGSLVTGLAASRPLLVGDNERAVLEVASGARWIGLSNLRFARRIRAGSPVRHVFLDPTPCVPVFGVLVRGARNPELGRQFVEWLASEGGQTAFAAAGRVACLPAVGLPTFATLAGEGVRPLFGTVDWVTDPSPWAERYRSVFTRSQEVGK